MKIAFGQQKILRPAASVILPILKFLPENFFYRTIQYVSNLLVAYVWNIFRIWHLDIKSGSDFFFTFLIDIFRWNGNTHISLDFHLTFPSWSCLKILPYNSLLHQGLRILLDIIRIRIWLTTKLDPDPTLEKNQIRIDLRNTALVN